MINLQELTIEKARKALDAKEFSVQDLVDAYKAQLAEKNPEINAVLEIFDGLEDQTAAAQKRIDAGEAENLTGIPMILKDNIVIEGRKASGASKILENYVAPYTATAAQKLLDQGVIVIGRANMDEFAMGGSTENSAYGVTKNPHDIERVSGGSSGGSAATVAMNGALATLGSDTGGSIRQPSAFCGVVGLKPTYGSVSRHGLMAMASSLDVIGPISKNVADAKIIYDAIKGADKMDSTSVDATKDAPAKKDKYKIGVTRALLVEGVDEDVLVNFDQKIEELKKAGHEIMEIDLDSLKYALAVYYILMPAEVSSNMARYDGIKYGQVKDGKDLIDQYFETRAEFIGEEVKRRIMLGTYVLSSGYYDAYYNKAWQVRNKIIEDFKLAFGKVDIIAMPTTPSPAFKIGENTDDPLQMYLQDIFTVSANLAGIPAISIPSGTVDREGKQLPLGMQFMGPHFSEEILFDIGQKFERI